MESKPFEGAENGVSRTRNFSRRIDILNADQPFAAALTGMQKARDCRGQRAEMKFSCGRGGKASDVVQRFTRGRQR